MRYGTQARAAAMVGLTAIFMEYRAEDLRRAARSVGINYYLTGAKKAHVAERCALAFINHWRTTGMQVSRPMCAEARNAWGV